MKSFQDFWTDLTANPHWVEWMERLARMEQKNLRKAAETAYGNLIADPQAFEKYSPEESRKYVGNILKNQKPEVVKPQLQQVEEKKEAVVEIQVPEEVVQQRLKEWKELVLASPLLKPTPRMTRKEFEENGGWEPKKEAPYPSTSENEVRAKEKHLRYLKANYDSRTREKLPEWTPEEIWNELND